MQKLGNLPQDEWFNEVEKLIRKEIVRKTEQPDAVTKLQAQIVTYKNIIDDTVGLTVQNDCSSNCVHVNYLSGRNFE